MGKVGTVNIVQFGDVAQADTSLLVDLSIREASIEIGEDRLLLSR